MRAGYACLDWGHTSLARRHRTTRAEKSKLEARHLPATSLGPPALATTTFGATAHGVCNPPHVVIAWPWSLCCTHPHPHPHLSSPCSHPPRRSTCHRRGHQDTSHERPPQPARPRAPISRGLCYPTMFRSDASAAFLVRCKTPVEPRCSLHPPAISAQSPAYRCCSRSRVVESRPLVSLSRRP